MENKNYQEEYEKAMNGARVRTTDVTSEQPIKTYSVDSVKFFHPIDPETIKAVGISIAVFLCIAAVALFLSGTIFIAAGIALLFSAFLTVIISHIIATVVYYLRSISRKLDKND